MKYIITNGTTYIKRTVQNQIRATYEKNEALVLDDENKAWNVLSCLPRAYKNDGYLPRKLLDEGSMPMTQTKKAAEVERMLDNIAKDQSRVAYTPEDSEWLKSLKDDMKTVDRILGAVKKTYAKACGDLNAVCLEINDIEHAIEFKNPNAAQGYYLEAELKKARRRRRELRDAKEILEQVMNYSLDDWGAGKLQNTLKYLSSRSYMPQVRYDLFK